MKYLLIILDILVILCIPINLFTLISGIKNKHKESIILAIFGLILNIWCLL